MVHEGRVGNRSVQQVHFERRDNIVYVEAIITESGNPNLRVWSESKKTLQTYIEDPTVVSFHILAHSPESADITFHAEGVPPLGYLAYSVRGKPVVPTAVRMTPLTRALARVASSAKIQKLSARFAELRNLPPYRIENEFFSVEASRDGTLALLDRRDGTRYAGLNHFVDGGDCGDEYDYCPPDSDAHLAPRLKRVRVNRGAVLQTMELELSLRAPEELAPDRKSRSKRMIDLPIVARVALAAGVRRVDIETKVDNRARDHRLRVHFPTHLSAASADYDGHFEVVNRRIGVPQHDPSWREEPRPEVPQRAFTDVTDGQHGIMIANRGLPEVETLRRADGSAEIALTLLRCVGWLSRDDFSTRNGHAGPFLPTADAQMIGSWTFDYSIIPHSGGWSEAFEHAYDFAAPMRAVRTGRHPGRLPVSYSMVEVSPPAFVINAIKMAEDDRGWLIRGVNLTGEKINVSLKPWRAFKKVERVNLAEQKIEAVKPAGGGKIILEARPHEIVTLKFVT